MKKFIAMLLALIMISALCACGSAISSDTAETGAAGTAAIPATEAETADPAAAEKLVSDAFIDPVGEWSRYDALIAAANSETDTAKRAEMLHEAEDILMSGYCVIPLYYCKDTYLQKVSADGIYTNAFGTEFFMYATLSDGSDTLRIGLTSEPGSLDPALAGSAGGTSLAANCFSGLYTWDAEGRIVPACAESCTVSDDGLTWTVTLKESLKWSDGSDLTASNFEYAWKRASAAGCAYLFSGFDGFGTDGGISVTAPDDITLQFVLSAPCTYMEELMASPAFYPVCRSYAEADSAGPDSWGSEAGFVSNGAYVCTDWEHGTSMTFEKNPYWYDAGSVAVEKLRFTFCADEAAVYGAYNAGDLDFAGSVPADEITALLAGDDPELHVSDELGTCCLVFNAGSSLFADKTPAQAACMREAFSLLIDRNYICENICMTGTAANACIPIGMADGNGGTFRSSASEGGYYDAYAINNDYDATVAKAVELLEAAGFRFENGRLSAETPISIRYLTESSSGCAAVAGSIREDLAVIGIEVTVQISDPGEFSEQLADGSFDAACEVRTADFNDPVGMLGAWTTASDSNDCRFGR